MSNVLVITTSLRARSNSDILAQRMVEGIKDAGHEVEVISLKGKELKFQVHEQNKGWSSVAVADKLGAFRGSIGEKRRIEAVKMWIE